MDMHTALCKLSINWYMQNRETSKALERWTHTFSSCSVLILKMSPWFITPYLSWNEDSEKCTCKDDWLSYGAKRTKEIMSVGEFFICPIACSTWMCKLTMRQVSSSSSSSNYVLVRRSGGMFKLVLPHRMFSMSNPRSAMTVSAGTGRSNKPNQTVSRLSKILPPHKDTRKEITPFWVTRARSLNVFVFL